MNPAPPSRREPLAFALVYALLLALAAALSLAYAHPPLVDWPEHLAQDAIVAHFTDPAWHFAQHYRTTGWFLPYQGFRALHIALAWALGDALGARVALLPYLLGTPLALLALVRRLGRDRWVSLAAFTLLVDGNFLWGFAPHALGTTLALVGLVLALDTLRAPAPSPARLALLALLGVALFFTHAQQTAWWIASCTALALFAHARGLVSRARTVATLSALAPGALLLALYLAFAGWISGRALHDEFAIAGRTLWHTPLEVLYHLAFHAGLSVMGRLPCFAYLAALTSLALAARATRHTLAPASPWSFVAPLLGALWTALLFALPAEYRGQTVAPRFASVALLALTWLPRVDPPRTPHAARTLLPYRAALVVCALASLAFAHARFHAFDRALRPLDAIIARIPPGARVATLAYDTHAPGFRLPVCLHLGGYVLAARGGLASSGFTRTGVTYATTVPRDALTVSTLWLPERTGWQLSPVQAGFYDAVLVRTGARYPGAPVVGGVGVTRVWQGEGFELWRVDDRAQSAR